MSVRKLGTHTFSVSRNNSRFFYVCQQSSVCFPTCFPRPVQYLLLENNLAPKPRKPFGKQVNKTLDNDYERLMKERSQEFKAPERV